MQLRAFAEIATIIGVVIAVLGYMKIEPNALDKIPEIYQEQASKDLESAELRIEENEYSGGKASLYRQYRAALAMESSYNRDQALMKVINAALNEFDFKIAIRAGKEISSSHTKSNELSRIVDSALKHGDSVGYAVIAAELIPSSYSKDMVLAKIVSFYERGTRQKKAKEELSDLDIYKEIFRFADSTAHMNMTEEEAKIFADQWQKERTYTDFLYFKEVFMFADSGSYMDMSAEDAKTFALNWIDNYTKDEFGVFVNAFKFADSTAGMDMSEKDAESFAFQKVEEYRKSSAANNKIQSTQ